ncbi:hypothetical protein NQ317_016891 [Molorchus minor]|uniref:BMP and activin membrane-bound inhibitor C-terminal domain-containing protein n=1 Tax=Molorchus minor TaxID=1323400 RepID=A0ABQ9K633_9CUCU|nr:hypothetical protein NQ317_016891 [Molorchus minor]
MCNHIESPQTKNFINNTLLGDITSDSEGHYQQQQQQQQEPFLYSDSEVWFRAATIAVPICGAVILFVLIALAVKILKNEHQNSRLNKLGPATYKHTVPPRHKGTSEKYNHGHVDNTYENLLRKEYIPTHHKNTFFSNVNEDFQLQNEIPLLVKNELISGTSGNMNEANAKLNSFKCDLESGKSIILEIEKGTEQCPESNMMDNNANSTSNYLPHIIDKYSTEKPFI